MNVASVVPDGTPSQPPTGAPAQSVPDEPGRGSRLPTIGYAQAASYVEQTCEPSAALALKISPTQNVVETMFVCHGYEPDAELVDVVVAVVVCVTVGVVRLRPGFLDVAGAAVAASATAAAHPSAKNKNRRVI